MSTWQSDVEQLLRDLEGQEPSEAVAGALADALGAAVKRHTPWWLRPAEDLQVALMDAVTATTALGDGGFWHDPEVVATWWSGVLEQLGALNRIEYGGEPLPGPEAAARFAVDLVRSGTLERVDAAASILEAERSVLAGYVRSALGLSGSAEAVSTWDLLAAVVECPWEAAPVLMLSDGAYEVAVGPGFNAWVERFDQNGRRFTLKYGLIGWLRGGGWEAPVDVRVSQMVPPGLAFLVSPDGSSHRWFRLSEGEPPVRPVPAFDLDEQGRDRFRFLSPAQASDVIESFPEPVMQEVVEEIIFDERFLAHIGHMNTASYILVDPGMFERVVSKVEGFEGRPGGPLPPYMGCFPRAGVHVLVHPELPSSDQLWVCGPTLREWHCYVVGDALTEFIRRAGAKPVRKGPQPRDLVEPTQRVLEVTDLVHEFPGGSSWCPHCDSEPIGNRMELEQRVCPGRLAAGLNKMMGNV